MLLNRDVKKFGGASVPPKHLLVYGHAQFTSDIRHMKGVDYPAAGALSRIEMNTLQVPQSPVLDFTEMATGHPSVANSSDYLDHDIQDGVVETHYQIAISEHAFSWQNCIIQNAWAGPKFLNVALRCRCRCRCVCKRIQIAMKLEDIRSAMSISLPRMNLFNIKAQAHTKTSQHCR